MVCKEKFTYKRLFHKLCLISCPLTQDEQSMKRKCKRLYLIIYKSYGKFT